VPISGTAFFVIVFTLHLETPKTPILAGLKAVDWLGSLTITGGTVMLLLGLQFGGTTFPWSSPTVICLIVFGLATITLFVAIESSPLATYPLVPAHLYTNTTNLATLLVVFFHGFAFTQGTYFLPMYFQSVLGAAPLLSGIWLLPFTVALSLTAVAAGIFLKRTGRYNPCIRAGLFVAVLGTGLFYDLPPSRVWVKIIAFQVLAGIGVGANFQPPLVALQSHVSPQDNAAATASFALARNAAAAISVVVGSVAFGNKMAAQQGMLRTALGDELAGLLAGGDAQANLFLLDGLSLAQQKVVRAALYKAVRTIWIETVCFSAAAMVACLFISEKKKLQDAHAEVRTGLEGEEERRKIALGARSKKGRDGEKAAA
jgi:MFS family permease